MSFSLIYLLQRFFYRLWVFVYNWYVGGFRFFGSKTISLLERLDRFWALRITFSYLFQPLYQDRGFLARVIGFIFRSLRIIIASMFYIVIVFFALILYVVWAWIPAGIIWYGAYGA